MKKMISIISILLAFNAYSNNTSMKCLDHNSASVWDLYEQNLGEEERYEEIKRLILTKGETVVYPHYTGTFSNCPMGFQVKEKSQNSELEFERFFQANEKVLDICIYRANNSMKYCLVK